MMRKRGQRRRQLHHKEDLAPSSRKVAYVLFGSTNELVGNVVRLLTATNTRKARKEGEDKSSHFRLYPSGIPRRATPRFRVPPQRRRPEPRHQGDVWLTTRTAKRP